LHSADANGRAVADAHRDHAAVHLDGDLALRGINRRQCSLDSMFDEPGFDALSGGGAQTDEILLERLSVYANVDLRVFLPWVEPLADSESAGAHSNQHQRSE